MKKFLLAVCCIISANLACAQDVQRPDIRVGDWWQYEIIDNWTNTVTDEFLLVVVDVSNGRIRLSRSSKDGLSYGEKTLELNTTINARNGTSYTPHEGTYSFPLFEGKKWVAEATMKSPQYEGNYKLDSVVAGWERIKVPAGEFNSLKVIQKGLYVAIEPYTGSGSLTKVSWYASECLCTVLSNYESRHSWRGTLYNRTTQRLVTFGRN
jgi:hypothetical protein